MKKTTYNKEEVERELNNWKEKIKQFRSKIELSKENSKVDVLGDIEKMESQEAVIKNKLIKLNEGHHHWEDIEESIGDALIQIKSTYDKANSKYNL